MRISTNFSFRNQTRVTYQSFLQFTGCVARAKFPRLPLFLFQRNVIIGQRSIKMDAEEISSIFNMKKVNHNIQFDLKNEQILATMSLQKRRNCVCFLPTGFGKSLIFVANTVIQQCPTITLIISPLLSLMDNQIKTLKTWNFSCGQITSATSVQEVQGNSFYILNLIY